MGDKMSARGIEPDERKIEHSAMDGSGESHPYPAVLSYRSAPLHRGLSPAELLMNHKLPPSPPCYTEIK